MVLAFGLVTPAEATGRRAAAACGIWLGSVTSAGGHTFSVPTASTPPSVRDSRTTAGVYAPGEVRFSSRFRAEPDIPGTVMYGHVVIGDALYANSYLELPGGGIDPANPSRLRRIGGGWTPFRLLETSNYETLVGTVSRSNAYALRENGVLYRWNTAGGVWRNAGSYAGFAAVKSMALISKTATYDTFLANTRGGALYTIRIPVSSPMKPVVKPVRTRTWQVFESLVAMKCGRYGTLLLGIDKDAKTGYLYAVGHANGTSTVIKSLGKVPATFADPVYFRWTPISVYDEANGE
jgi:hypothetical protein